jgi:hypothetical protein
MYCPKLWIRLCPLVRTLTTSPAIPDKILSDLTLYHALRTLQAEHPEASITKSLALFKVKGGVSGGSINTARSVAELPRSQQSLGEFCLTPRTSSSTSSMCPALLMILFIQSKLRDQELHSAYSTPLTFPHRTKLNTPVSSSCTHTTEPSCVDLGIYLNVYMLP